MADGGEQIDDPGGVVLGPVFHDVALVGIKRRQVVKEHEVSGGLGRREADLAHAKQGEVAFALLWGADLARDHVALAQAEAPDLGRRDIDVVRTGHVTVHGRTQEPEPVRQDFQDALAEDGSVLGGATLQEGEDKLLLAHALATGPAR